MTDCVLHIGVEKTGSTSLQSTLAGNRDALLAGGVLYPQSLGQRSHINAYVFASNGGMELVKRQAGLSDPQDLAAYRRTIKASLHQEISMHRPRTLCISNEHCSCRLSSVSEVERLRGLIADFCDKITVMVYLRAQGDAHRSAYTTYVRTGGAEAFKPPRPDEIESRFDYEAMLGRWAHVFGTENLKPRLYEPDQWVGGNLVSDFMSVLDPASRLDVLSIETRLNPSLGRVGVEFLRAMNRLLPYEIDGEINPLRGNLHDLVGVFAEDAPFEGDADIIDALDEAMSAGNERVRLAYFPHLEAPLFKHAVRKGAAAPLPDEAAARLKLMAHLWTAKQQQVLELKGRLDRQRRAGGRGGG